MDRIVFIDLELDKSEWIEDIKNGEGSLKAFLVSVDNKRESRKFKEGLNSKVTLSLSVYKAFGKKWST